MNRARVPGDGLLDLRVLACVLALVINDHWAKAALPGAITGKISDVAGLAFFPLFLQGLAELVRPSLVARRRTVLVAACALTALVFTLVKTWAPAGEIYRMGLAALQWPVRSALAGAMLPLGAAELMADPSDLWALPAVLIAYAIGSERGSERDAHDRGDVARKHVGLEVH